MSSRQTYSYGGIGDSYRSSYGGSAYDGAGLSSIYAYRTSPRLPSVETYSATDTASLYADKLAEVYSKQGLGASSNYSAAASSLYGTSAYDPSLLAGTKRSMEAFYHQTLLGSHNSFGETEALFSSNSLIKRPRFETGSNLPIYPQRPGEKDCAYYMMTRTCKFGEACKFDHPFWVPEGGIPDWKEIPLVPTSESLPERPGEPDCPYYMKTQKCKFGIRCKFNHPNEKLNDSANEVSLGVAETTDVSTLPERPTEPICSFYMKTKSCKFGANCKFHHPKDLQLQSNEQNGVQDLSGQHVEATVGVSLSNTHIPVTPALLHNSKGLPIRPGETDCPFYLKTGSCKYGATCRFNHPDRNAINPSFVAGLAPTVLPAAASLSLGVLNPTANFLQNIDMQTAQTSLGILPTSYPQRPGEIECDGTLVHETPDNAGSLGKYYMKTGLCKFGERCKFHHPVNRSAPTSGLHQASEQTVKLTLAGLPRRQGATVCAFYMKTGTCKFAAACKFDHPPPGEAIALATVQVTGGNEAAPAEEK